MAIDKGDNMFKKYQHIERFGKDEVEGIDKGLCYVFPKLLGIIFHELIKEESWNIIKKFKNPTIDFKKLQTLTNSKIKQELPELFN